MPIDDENLKAGRSDATLWERVVGRYYSTGADLLHRRVLQMQASRPTVSFTFDDFPRTALLTGGEILRQSGVAGTYYACMGLMGGHFEGTEMFCAEDLPVLLAQGHELGSHTFGHSHAAQTSTEEFERSVNRNQEALETVLPGVKFETLSYPWSAPRASTKQRIASRFVACRGGGRTAQVQSVDLNYLSSRFIEHYRDDAGELKHLIESNRETNGWLILNTHDVQAKPTRYGCTPELLKRVVEWTLESGAQVLPVAAAVKALGAKP